MNMLHLDRSSFDAVAIVLLVVILCLALARR